MSSEQETKDLPTHSPLRITKTLITTHNTAGQATLSAASHPANYIVFEKGDMFFNQIFTNTFPADLNDEQDITAHEKKIKEGKLGLATKSGTVCRQVDFAPGYVCMMHRTQSLDFGVVLEGEVDMLLDDGTEERMRRGDVAVQRATMHAWRNPSATEWARMMFVLQDIKPLIINGKRYGEDYGPTGTEGLPHSDNDG